MADHPQMLYYCRRNGLSTFTHRLNFGSGLIRAAPPLLQGAVRPAQPLPQAPHLLLSRAQSRFWALLFIGQSCFVRLLRILSTLRDSLQDVPKPGPLTKIVHPGSIWSSTHGVFGPTIRLPCNMAVHTPSLSPSLSSSFCSSQLPPYLPSSTLVHRPSPGFISSVTSASLDLFMGL
jgi:hypothetical protein